MSNLFHDELVRQGITSGAQLAEKFVSPAVIFFFAGGTTPYAELRWWNAEGEIFFSRHLPQYPDLTVTTCRRKTVEAAQGEAKERLGLGEWTRAPFSNCWLPSDVLHAARQEFMSEPESKTA